VCVCVCRCVNMNVCVCVCVCASRTGKDEQARVGVHILLMISLLASNYLHILSRLLGILQRSAGYSDVLVFTFYTL